MKSAPPDALLLASTAGFAFGMALQDGRFIPLTIGALLFLISDLILAKQVFNGMHFRVISDVVWLFYGSAHMLIVVSGMAAGALLAT